jgi:hypothetical protein
MSKYELIGVVYGTIIFGAILIGTVLEAIREPRHGRGV